jgi:hypothetical protein
MAAALADRSPDGPLGQIELCLTPTSPVQKTRLLGRRPIPFATSILLLQTVIRVGSPQLTVC